MKANIKRAIALALPASLTLASCAERRVEPTPTPTQSARPAPQPAPRPAPIAQGDWRQAPITPGNWTWDMIAGRSTASFAGGLFQMRCDRPKATITLLRRGTSRSSLPASISTAAMTRPLSAAAVSTPAPALAITLDASDPLLDAMAFSRGRFAVEISGMQSLYLPSWPEVSRVIEDCR